MWWSAKEERRFNDDLILAETKTDAMVLNTASAISPFVVLSTAE